MTKLPRFYQWGGGGVPFKWSLGWLCGRDGDLVCVKLNSVSDMSNDYALSPVCSNKLLAIVGFVAKRLLVSIDSNEQNL